MVRTFRHTRQLGSSFTSGRTFFRSLGTPVPVGEGNARKHHQHKQGKHTFDAPPREHNRQATAPPHDLVDVPRHSLPLLS
jgi:hypothetical protein